MFDMSDDMIHVRNVERISFLWTLGLLLYLDLLWFATIYIWVGFSIIFSDEATDDLHENDIDNWFLHNVELSTVAERQGFVLNDDDILELLHTANEDPVLPLSYRMVNNYIDQFLEKSKNFHKVKKNYEYSSGSYQPIINYDTVKNFTKYKVTIKKEFEAEINKSRRSLKYDLIKFKSVGLVLNEYLTTGLFTKGLYPVNDYDLFLFKAYNVPLTIQYPLYTLLFPTKKDIYISEMNNDVSNADLNLNSLNLKDQNVIRVKNKRIKYLKTK